MAGPLRGNKARELEIQVGCEGFETSQVWLGSRLAASPMRGRCGKAGRQQRACEPSQLRWVGSENHTRPDSRIQRQCVEFNQSILYGTLGVFRQA